MNFKKLITSESVGRGHPDKICDQISDLILDKCLEQDPNSKVACEVFASNRLIVIGGEITTNAYVDFVKAAWEVVKPLGYTENDFTIISNVNSQSPDINQAVEKVNGEIGAGDQGIVYGYATNETPQYLPLPIVLANDLLKELDKVIKAIDKECNTTAAVLKYDMKSQVTIDYTDSKAPRIDTMLISVQHEEGTPYRYIKNLCEDIMIKVAKTYKLNTDFKKLVNPSGKFVIGGPIGDTGLTGRKIIVDTYGGVGRHGGGAFSGKDPTKVDRTGAYYARYIAKNIVAAKLADKCEVQLSFAIGETKPVSIHIDTFGTNKIPMDEIYELVNEKFSMSVSQMIKTLNMRKPQFKNLAVFGHFGKDKYAWEKTGVLSK